jgi:hypothetical protein
MKIYKEPSFRACVLNHVDLSRSPSNKLYDYANRTMASPSPGGEGRGEGELSKAEARGSYLSAREKNRRKEDGLATIVFITLLAIMVLLAAANTAALIHLHRDVKLLEQNQIKRLNASQAVPATAANNNPNSK